MRKSAYLPKFINPLLTRAVIPYCVRIIPARTLRMPLSVAIRDGRFCPKSDGVSGIYFAPKIVTTFAERFVRDNYVRQQEREIPAHVLYTAGVVLIRTKPGVKLCLLDLRDDSCARLGAPTDTVRARNQAASFALGRDIYYCHKNIDGIIYPSRIDGRDVYVIFDRAIDKLEVVDTCLLPDFPGHQEAISRYRMRIVPDTSI